MQTPNFLKIFSKEAHLKQYLEEQFKVEIVYKYGAYLIIDLNGYLIDFYYSLDEVKEFLENKQDFQAIMIANKFPADLFNKEEKDENKE